MNVSLEKVKHRLVLFVYAGSAESGPPLGTVLGNLGVNTVKFCKQFNEYTEKLPFYLKLKGTVFVLEDMSFDFIVDVPSTGHIISLLKKDKYIKLNDVLKLCLFKFPEKNLKESFPIV